MANENLGLVKHHLDRFGVLTVMDVTLFDTVTNAPVLELDTLKVSSISTEGSTKEIRGGLNADLLITYDHSRTVNIEIQDALLSMYSLQKFWGGVLNQDEIVAHEKIVVKCTVAMASSKTITLEGLSKSYNLVDDYKNVKVYNAATGAEYTVASLEKEGAVVSGIVLDSEANIAEDDVVWIYAKNVYSKATNASEYQPLELILKSNSFPAAVKLVGKTVFVEQQSGKQVLAEIEIVKMKISPSLTFSMDAEGEASTFDFSASALVDTETKDILKIKTLAYVEGILD